MEEEKHDEVVEETTDEPVVESQPTPQPQGTDLSAVLEAIADLKQVITTALTQVEPETVEAVPVEEPEPVETDEAPQQDVDEIAKFLEQ